MLCHVLIIQFNSLIIRTLFFLHFWLLITWMHLKILLWEYLMNSRDVLLMASNLFANWLLQLVSQRWMSWWEIVLSFNTHCNTHFTSIVVSFFDNISSKLQDGGTSYLSIDKPLMQILWLMSTSSFYASKGNLHEKLRTHKTPCWSLYLGGRSLEDMFPNFKLWH
jgi:hypothetical protein